MNDIAMQIPFRLNGAAKLSTRAERHMQARLAPSRARSLAGDLTGLDVQLFAAPTDHEPHGNRVQQSLAEALSKAARHEVRSLNSVDSGERGRLSLLRRLQLGVAEAFRYHTHLALMFIDLHGREIFEAVPRAGLTPKLLTVVATRDGLDTLPAAIALDDPARRVSVTAAVRSHIEGRYQIDGREMQIGISVGIALAAATREPARLHSLEIGR